jgi:hypothetical protein
MPYAGQLTLADIAFCADVEAPRLRSWTKKNDLAGRPPFTEYDAIEAAIAFSMPKAGVSQKAARSSRGTFRLRPPRRSIRP